MQSGVHLIGMASVVALPHKQRCNNTVPAGPVAVAVTAATAVSVFITRQQQQRKQCTQIPFLQAINMLIGVNSKLTTLAVT